MYFIFQKDKIANNPSLWFGASIASAMLIGSVAYAEPPNAKTNVQNPNESKLIPAIALDPIQPRAQEQVKPAKSDESALVQRINQELKETLSSDKTAQSNVTSVSQLADVRPTDWAFTALQSLVERYGCIAGYPDRKLVVMSLPQDSMLV